MPGDANTSPPLSASHSPPPQAGGGESGKENTRPGTKPKSAATPPPPPVASPDPILDVPETPLTERNLKEFVRQQRLAEKQGVMPGYESADVSSPVACGPVCSSPQHQRRPTDPNSLAVNGAVRATPLPQPLLNPHHSRHPTDVTPHRKSPSPDADGDGESDGEPNFLSPRTQRWVESYIDSLQGIVFEDEPNEVVSEDSDRDQLQRKIRFMARDTLKTLLLDYNDELSAALGELITLDEKVMEMDDDNAHLELLVGRKQESIDMLQVQLSASEDYASALLAEKTETQRKLTSAKTELALIGARNAKLQKQISARGGEDASHDSCELGRTLNMLSVDTLASTQDNDSGHSSPRGGSREEPGSPSGSRLVVEAATRSVADAHARLEVANKRVEALEAEATAREHKLAEMQAKLERYEADDTPRPPRAPVDAAKEEGNAQAQGGANRKLHRLSTAALHSQTDDSEGEENPGVGRRDVANSSPRRDGKAPRDGEREDEAGARGRVNNVWRRMYEDSILRLSRMERELERFKAAAATTASSSTPKPPQSSPPPEAKATGGDEREDPATTALRNESQKLRQQLTAEQERSRRLSTSEDELLTQVADLARKLREKENAERSVRAQRRESASRNDANRSPTANANVAAQRSKVSNQDASDPPLEKTGRTDSRGANSNSDEAAQRRSDVLKAFEEVKLRAVRTRTSRRSGELKEITGRPTVLEDDDEPRMDDDPQDLSYSPHDPNAKTATAVTRSPSPPHHQRIRSGSLLVPSGYLRKSINNALNSARDPLMSSLKSVAEDSGTHDPHMRSSVSSLVSPRENAMPPHVMKSPGDDVPLDNSFNGLQLSAQAQQQHQQQQQQQAPQRRSVTGSGGAVPAPVRVPIRLHAAPTNATPRGSVPTTPRGSRERPSLTLTHTDDALAATTNAVSRRGITRGSSQDRAARRRSASQTVNANGGPAKTRSSSIRAGSGAAVVAGRRP